MVYFDEQPKSKMSDLFGREKEVEELMESLRKRKLTLILGLRRTGKTSVLLTSLDELKFPYLFIDFRGLGDRMYYTHQDFVNFLERSFTEFLKRHGDIAVYLRSIEGVSIRGFEIKFRREERVDLISIFNSLDEWAGKKKLKLIVAFDEIQESKKIVGLKLQPIIAYSYDHLSNVSFVMSGSEMGLVYKFLQVDDPKAPLYGRYISEIKLENFSEEKSKEFLIKGFKQFKMKVDEQLIKYAIKKFDGIPGWLTFFGVESVRKKRIANEKEIDRILEKATKLALLELNNFLEFHRATERYKILIRTLSRGPAKWSELKEEVSLREGRTIRDRSLANLLNTLIAHSIVQKEDGEYKIADPIIAAAAKKL